MKLVELRSPAAADTSEFAAIVPMGAVEQHSTHLPVGTDAMITTAVCEAVEARLPGSSVLLPTFWYGASGYHEIYAGTASVGTAPLVASITAMLGSVFRSTGIRRYLLVNGHGGNQPAVRLVLEQAQRELTEAIVWGLDYWDAMFTVLDAANVSRPAEMGHADELETSMMLAIHGHLVDMTSAEPDAVTGNPPPFVHTASGFARRTRHGGEGDPTGSTKERGNELLVAAASGLATVVRQ
ncbi:MAG: creatininase family protein, partial [Acetobacteraceae bacterium]